MKEVILSIDENKKNWNRSVGLRPPDCSVLYTHKIAKFPNGTMADYYDWPVPVVLFLTIRSVVRNSVGSSKAPDLIGRTRSVKMIRSPVEMKRVPGELFYTLARLAIHCNPLKGRNANIKPLYWINSVAIGITVCVFAHRVPWQMTAAYTRHPRLSTPAANRSSGFA